MSMEESDLRAFARQYRLLPDADKASFIGSLSAQEAYAISQIWAFNARDSQIPADGDWFVYLFLTGRGWGKELDIHTPIPTPNGWKEMVDLVVGDIVFDEQGCPTRVTEVFPVTLPNVCYRIHFSDGTHIDASGEHRWVTWTHADRKAYLRSPYENTTQFPDDWVSWALKRSCGGAEPKIYPDSPRARVRTTQEIADSVRYGRRGDLNHCIPQCRPLQLPEAELPIPPYTLGLWLADGNSSGGSIDKHQDDLPFLRERIEREGFKTSDSADTQRFGTRGLTPLLRQNHLLGNKHIPPIYLRASFEQRLAFLEGLLDGDGYVGENNYCEFSNTNPSIADGVYELLIGMGIRVTRASKVPTLNGKPCAPTTILKFVPTFPVFSLPRKRDRLRFDRSQSLRRFHRMIVDVERIPSKPMRCISVDSPNSMYLASEAMIPTHNTRALTGWADAKARDNPGCRIAFVGATAADARDVLVKGDSGVLDVAPDWDKPHYSPTYRMVEWSNGSRAWLYSAEEANRLRGPQHHFGIADEIVAWSDLETWDNLIFGMRLGEKPQIVVGTTPKPSPFLRALIAEPTTMMMNGSMLENAKNLAPSFIAKVMEKYGGSRLGDQEIEGKLLDDLVGALWKSGMFEREGFRVNATTLPELAVKCVAIDPAVTSNAKSNETGIIVAGAEHRKRKGTHPLKHLYILQDLTTNRPADEWAKIAVDAFHDHNCDFIVAETNNGGDLVTEMIATVDPNVPVRTVHASVSKQARAEPIVTFYAQGRAHHYGTLKELEDQMLDWIPGAYSPDRVDSCVWAGHALMIGEEDEAPVMRRAEARFGKQLSWGNR